MIRDNKNTIIDVITTLIEFKENDKITDFKISWNVEDNTLDINVIPKKSTNYIQTKFTVLPNGSVFN